MRPSHLLTFLTRAIPACRPVLVTGEPGGGKSELIAEAARLCGADVILSHPAVSDPTDVKGLPWAAPDQSFAHFLPFGDLARALAATKLTAWVLEDLGQASASVQAAFMQLLLTGRVGDHVLPPCVAFIGATNRRTDRAGVTGILEPVKSRFASIVELEVNLDDWCAWALRQDYVPAELVAFLRFRPDLLSQFKPTADMTNSPLPRTWANAARLLQMGLPAAIEQEVVGGAVGKGAATELFAFYSQLRELPSIDMILKDPNAQRIPTQPSTLFAVTTGLGARANPENFAQVARYAERLMEENRGEFAALLLKDAVRRDDAITRTPAFTKLASSPLSRLIIGEV